MAWLFNHTRSMDSPTDRECGEIRPPVVRRVVTRERLGIQPEHELLTYVHDDTGEPISEADWAAGRWTDVTRHGDAGIRRFMRIGDRRS